ncbi:MAG: histidine--tRNA ligase [Candidatus Omnitrophica bacterium]|nr:histidine--tRNA ligase [Candidatus Omnitrophota bacterium]
MPKKFAVPRGTSDILPDQAGLWEELESKARLVCQSYGYREIRTPIYEDINLFKRSLGAASDVVNKQLLELAGSKEDEGYALRPEGTAAVVRSYIENSMDGKESLSKLFYIGAMFRGERPQKGRLRQFHQIGAEAIGPNSTSAFLDAELIALAMHLLKEFGVKGLRLKINSLGSREDKAHISLWLRETFAHHKDNLCEECQNRFERNVFRVLDCKNESCRKEVAAVVKDLPLSPESQDYFGQVQASLKGIGVAFEVSAHLVRGLDYYTHTVFEITAEGLGSQDAVGAGGRYNGLVQELGGNEKINYGAIGFALGIERILLASGKAASKPKGLDAFVIAMKEEYQSRGFLILQELRREAIRADMSFTVGSMKSQMGRCDKAGARFALILGEEEIKNNTVSLKDMRTGQQETLAVENLVSSLKDKLCN